MAAIRFLVSHDELSGPVNIATPEASTNRGLMGALRSAAGARMAIPAPRWLLEPGMLVLRQESELVLKSRWVFPEKLLDAGFAFRWPELEPAIADLTRSW